MQEGDVFQGEFTLTNTGLIRADNLDFILPADDEFFRYELIEGLPDSLDAKAKLVIPYRVICLKTPTQEDDGAATGGGCSKVNRCVVTEYDYTCPNGTLTNSSTSYCFLYDRGTCSSTAPVPSNPTPPLFHFGGSGTSYTTGAPATPSPSSSNPPKPPSSPIDTADAKCIPEPGKTCPLNPPPPSCDSCQPGNTDKKDSEIDLLRGEYLDDIVDLSVMTGSGTYEIMRNYYNDRWEPAARAVPLKVLQEKNSVGVVRKKIYDNGQLVSVNESPIYKTILYIDGVKFMPPEQPLVVDEKTEELLPEYNLNTVEGTLFRFRSYANILVTGTGYRWEDKYGNWRIYENIDDTTARILQEGDLKGLTWQYLYDTVNPSQVIGVADRSGSQVVWYEYTGGQISAVRDADNRRVEYYYTDNKLTRVVDVRGKETIYAGQQDRKPYLS
jgi:hypothetical protein